MTRPGEIGVVFVNFHSEALIRPRAAALRAAGLWVVVADNSGTFGDNGPAVVDMGGNLGFAAGCNRGASALPSGVGVICFHNPDVDATVDDIARMVDRLRAEARPGVIAPTLLTDGHLRPAGFRYPSPARELVLATRAAWRSRAPANAQAAPDPAPRGGGRRFASAALAVVSRRAFEAVGGFDEAFFLYGEDLDLWHRLHRAGFSTGFAPEVVVSTARKAGSPATSIRRELLRWLGVELFAERHHEGWRRFRAVHLPFLGPLLRHEPALATVVRPGYRRWRPPSEIMSGVRSLLSTA